MHTVGTIRGTEISTLNTELSFPVDIPLGLVVYPMPSSRMAHHHAITTQGMQKAKSLSLKEHTAFHLFVLLKGSISG